MLPERTVRQLTLGLSFGTIAFGVVPVFWPRFFSRQFGIPLTEGPAADVMVRSIGARDAISGIGILSATLHGGRVAPWLLARALADGTDTLEIIFAWLSGARDVRLMLLGAAAAAATVVDVFLWRQHKAARSGNLPDTQSGTGAAG